MPAEENTNNHVSNKKGVFFFGKDRRVHVISNYFSIQREKYSSILLSYNFVNSCYVAFCNKKKDHAYSASSFFFNGSPNSMLFCKSHRSSLPDHGNFDLAGVCHFCLNFFGKVIRNFFCFLVCYFITTNDHT